MRRTFSILQVLSALILLASCQKTIKPSSVDLTKGAKAGFQPNPSWQLNTPTGRLVPYDINDGTGLSCLLSYDVGNNQVELTQIIGTTSTNLWTRSGIALDDGTVINVNQYAPADNYNEVGGYHIISYDATNTGHQTYLLLWVPGQGIAMLIHYVGGGQFHRDWSSTSGIAGYDLKGTTDKIIAYDYGSGYKNSLIVYRPGNGFCWVIENTSPSGTPNWIAAVKGSGGIGGFDLKGATDQIVAVDYNPGYQNLICYRPGYGYVWYLNHTPNSTNFTTAYSTHSGLFNFSFMDQQDRLIASNISGSTVINANNTILCYRPGGGMGQTVLDAIDGSTPNGGAPPSGLSSYPMSTNPYGSPASYIGDKILAFNGNGYGSSSLVCYTNGGTAYSTYIYEYDPNTQTYTLAFH